MESDHEATYRKKKPRTTSMYSFVKRQKKQSEENKENGSEASKELYLSATELKKEYLSHHTGPAFRYKVVYIKSCINWILELAVNIWEFLIMLVIITTSCLCIYHSTFTFGNASLDLTLFILYIIYGLDVALRLGIEIWRLHTGTNFVIFAVQYTFKQMVFDILSLLPLVHIAFFFIIVFNPDSLYWLTQVNKFYLIRLFMLYRGEQYITHILDYRSFHTTEFIVIMKMFFYYFICIELFSAFLYLNCGESYLQWILWNAPAVVDDPYESCYLTFRRKRGYFQENTKENRIPADSELFVFTMSFVTTIITTTGNGSTVPLTNLEIIIVILIVFVGILINGFLASKMLDFRIEKDAASYDLFYRLQVVETQHNFTRTHEFFMKRLKEYYLYNWNFRQGVKESGLDSLPLPMKESIMSNMCEEMFHKSFFFCDVEQTVLTALSLNVTLQMYNPEMIICGDGECSTKMFFLIQGEVIVRSKTKIQHPAAILRPGTIIGEINLMFSIPYEMQIETRTVCQTLILDREDLFRVLDLHPHVLNTLRLKFAMLIDKMTDHYEFVGEYPLHYALRKRQSEENPRYILRRKYFFNIHQDDIVDDTTRTYIMSMPTRDKDIARDYTRPYKTCPIPVVFVFGHEGVQIYNRVCCVIILILGIILPICAAYHEDGLPSSKLYQEVCNPLLNLQIVNIIIPIFLIIMLMIELYIASPSSGLWFGLMDGLKIIDFLFYLDLICMILSWIPRTVWGIDEIRVRNPFIVIAVIVVIQYTKIWRYFKLLDNLHPLRLPLVRVFKMLTTLFYFIHVTACYLYWITVNNGIHWLDTITLSDENIRFLSPILKKEGAYLYPLVFSTAMLSAGGFSTFSGQTFNEIIALSILEIMGFFLLALLVTELASGLCCTSIPRLRLYQQLVGINQCLKHFDVNEKLRNRVLEHYGLHFQFTKGVNLGSGQINFLYDAPHYLTQVLVDSEYRIYLQGVPLFSNADDGVLHRVVKTMRYYLLPPGITFVKYGEVHLQMYIIANGNIGLFRPTPEVSKKKKDFDTRSWKSNTSSIKSQEYEEEPDKPMYLGPTAHFGIRDLLFSEPSLYDVKTLSHVHLYVIDQNCLRESIGSDEKKLLSEIISSEVKLARKQEDRKPNMMKKDTSKAFTVEVSSWIHFPVKFDQNYVYCTHEEYNRFWNVPLGSFFKHFMMDKTVHPVGAFAKFWTIISSLSTLGILLTLFIELLTAYRAPLIRILNLIFDSISWMDIYIKLHWAYYTHQNHLVSHPAKTSVRYIKEGMFFYDCCFAVPLELGISVIEAIYSDNVGIVDYFRMFLGYSHNSVWYTKLRWVRFFQSYRYFALFKIVWVSQTGRIYKFILFYLTLILSVAIMFASVVLYFGCPWRYNDWVVGDEYRLPYCYKTWTLGTIDYTFYPIFPRMIIGLYYSVQTLFLVGYGDLIVVNEYHEVALALVMSLVGILLLVFVASDITAAEVDNDEAREAFIEKKTRIVYLLEKSENGCGRKWIKSVSDHLNYSWLVTRGMQPRQLFADLHPRKELLDELSALAHDLFKHIVGSSLDGIPLFQNLSETTIKHMCNLFEKVNFLKGHYIARIGNLQFEFCVIIRGSAYVCNSRMKWLCTLRSGEFFGESDLLFEFPRKHAIIAATNIELLVLSLNDFNILLTYYPDVREKMLSMLKDSLNDVHESKIRGDDAIDEEYMKVVEQNTEEMRNVSMRQPRSREGIANKRGNSKQDGKSKQWVYGIQDFDLPYIYFATNNPKIFKLLPHPKCGYIKFHEKMAMLTSFFYPCVALYLIIFIWFGPTPIIGTDILVEKIVIILCVIFQIILTVDVIIRILTPFELPDPDTYCKIWRKILLNYFTDPKMFFLDLVSVPPWYLIHGSLVLLLFLRLIYFYGHLYKSQADNVDFSTFSSQLYLYGSFFILLGHVTACMFFHMANISPTNTSTWITIYTNSFIEEDDKPSQFTWCWYLRALYFSFITITTTGLGDIVPMNLNTYIVTIIAMFVGAFGVSLIIANITVGLTSLTKVRRVYFYNYVLLTNHLRNLGLSPTLEYCVRAYSRILWQICRGAPIHEALKSLPLTVRYDISAVLFSRTLQRCQMFGTIGELTFIRNVCALLIHSTFLPGQYIAREGELGDKLFIVHRGEVASYERDGEGSMDFLKMYFRGDAFGKTTVFYPGCLYLKSYRAESLTEILIISQSDIKFIGKYYPKWQFYVENFMHARHMHFLVDTPHIFME